MGFLEWWGGGWGQFLQMQMMDECTCRHNFRYQLFVTRYRHYLFCKSPLIPLLLETKGNIFLYSLLVTYSFTFRLLFTDIAPAVACGEAHMVKLVELKFSTDVQQILKFM